MSLPKDFADKNQKRVEKILNYVQAAESFLFDDTNFEKLDLSQVAQRYVLARDTLLKEVDSGIKVKKAKEGSDPEMDNLLNIIMSLDKTERAELKKKILEIKKNAD